MSFQSLDYFDGMQVGYHPDWRARTNVKAFEKSQNLLATPQGLKQFWPFDGPDAAYWVAQGIAPAWPFPEMFLGQDYWIVMTEDHLYYMDKDEDADLHNQTLYDFATYNPYTDAADPKAITGDLAWHFADFGPVFLLFNGSEVVFKTGYSDKIFVTDSFLIRSGCAYKEGRAVFAGFDESDAWWTAFSAWIDDYQDDLPDQLQFALTGLTQKWLYWTSVMGGDMFGFFNLNLNLLKYNWFDATQNTGYSDAKPYWFDLAKRNQFGARPATAFYHMVEHVLPLGDGVIGYSKGGHQGLWPYSQPVSTLGARNPAHGVFHLGGLDPRLGILNREAVGGSDEVHAFLDPDYNLWVVTADYKAERLGWSHVLKDLSATDTVVTYHPGNREFWIGDGLLSFCLSRTGGLTKGPYCATTIASTGSFIGAWFEATEHDVIELKTLPFNAAHGELGGRAGQIMGIHAARISTLDQDAAGWYAQLNYRLKRNETWTTTAATFFDDRGYVSFDNIPAIEAQVIAKHDDRSKTNGLDGFWIDVTLDGKFGSRHWLDAAAPGLPTLPSP